LGTFLSYYVKSISRNVVFWLGLILFVFGVSLGSIFENLPFHNLVIPAAGLALIIFGMFYRLVRVYREYEK